MSFAIFSPLEILQKSLNIVFILISLIVGVLIILKYFKYKSPVFITVGLAWVLMSSPWWSIAINFLSIGFFDADLPYFWYLFIERGFIMTALFFWLYSFAELIYIKYKTYIKYGSFIFCAVIELILVVILLTAPSLIGSQIPEKPYEYSHTFIDVLLVLGTISGALITGTIFSIQSIKSRDIKIKWKGRFLLFSFASFTLGSILNGLLHVVIPFNPFSTILIRSILILSAIAYYFGFFLPEPIAEFLSK
jgi:hypothetical protein